MQTQLTTTPPPSYSPIGEWRRARTPGTVSHLVSSQTDGLAGTHYGLACGRTYAAAEMTTPRYGTQRCASCCRAAQIEAPAAAPVVIVSSTSTTACMRRALEATEGDVAAAVTHLQRTVHPEARAAARILRSRASRHAVGTRFEIARNGALQPVTSC